MYRRRPRRHRIFIIAEYVNIPKRLLEMTTGKGPMDAAYLASLKDLYGKAISDVAVPGGVSS
jgi:hypothetical protein